MISLVLRLSLVVCLYCQCLAQWMPIVLSCTGCIKNIAITEVIFYFLMVLMAYCELLTSLRSICISNICISTSEFEGERTKSETVMPLGKQHFTICWTLVICFFDIGSCVLIHKVTLKTIINSSLT